MTFPSVAIVVGIVLLAAIWLVLTQRRRARQKAALISAMGFQPVKQPDPQLTEALLALYGRGRGGTRGKGLKLSRMFHRHSLAGHLYLFDVRDPGSSRRSQVASDVVGIVRHEACLPLFAICSFAEEGGTVAKLMIGLIRKVLGDAQVVHFDDLPEFSRRFTVLSPGEDGEEAVRSYLTAGVRQKLMGFEFVLLMAGGVAFALQGNPYSATHRGNESSFLRKLVDDVSQAAEVLEPRESSSGEAVST